MEGREQGIVKAWIDERGMGFITPASGGTDHFVHRSMVTDGGSLAIGASVTFVPNWDADKGKPIATQVIGGFQQAGGGGAPGGDGGKGWAPAAPAQPAWQQQQQQQAQAPPAGSAQGTVKAWIEERGMGFIAPADGSGDLFVHRSMLADGQGLVVGSTVYYTPGWDAQKAKATASNVQGASAGQKGGPPQQAYGKGAPQGGAGSGDNLYISGLPVDSTEESVRATFGQYGGVTNVKVLPYNGSPFSVALVRMAATEQAKWLVDNLNGNIPLGLETVVQVKYSQSGAGGGKGAAPGPPQQDWQPWGAQPQGKPTNQNSDNLYIAGLPADTTTESVTALLSQYGTVTSAKVLDNGMADKVALVRMGTAEEAKWIVDNLDGNIPQGITTVIKVKIASNNNKGDKGGDKGGYGPAKGDPYGGKGMSPWDAGKGGKSAQFVAPPAAAPANKNSLNITGLPGNASGESIMQLIGQYGTVVNATMTGPGSATLTMGDTETAQWLVANLDGNIPQGLDTPIGIKAATSGGGGGGAPAGPPAQSGQTVMGTVKHWREDRGMGFVAPNDGSADCFVHRSNLVDGLALVPGQQVQFQLGWDVQKNKPTANHVQGAVGGDGVGKGAAKFADGGKGKGW